MAIATEKLKEIRDDLKSSIVLIIYLSVVLLWIFVTVFAYVALPNLGLSGFVLHKCGHVLFAFFIMGKLLLLACPAIFVIYKTIELVISGREEK